MFFRLGSFYDVLSILDYSVAEYSQRSAIFIFYAFRGRLRSIAFYFLYRYGFSPLHLTSCFGTFPVAVAFDRDFDRHDVRSFFIGGARPIDTGTGTSPAVLFCVMRLFVGRIRVGNSFDSSL